MADNDAVSGDDRGRRPPRRSAAVMSVLLIALVVVPLLAILVAAGPGRCAITRWWWTKDEETIGGDSAETVGEYQSYLDEMAGGCATAVVIGPDGRRVDDPSPDTPIEPMTGVSLEAEIIVRQRAVESD